MSDWIIIRTGASPADTVAWAAFRDGAVVESGQVDRLNDLATAIAEYSDDARLGVVLAGEQVAMRKMPAPPRQSAKLISAAHLLFEDELAAPIDEQHIAIDRSGDEAIIIAISKTQMTAWMAAFDGVDLTPDLVTVDFLCLDAGGNEGVLFIENGRVIAALGEHSFAAEAELVKPLIASFLAEHVTASVGVYKMGEAMPGTSVPQYNHLGESGDLAMLTLAANAIAKGRAPTLLQGDFRPPRKNIIDMARWRRPAMLAASLGLVFLVATFADGMRSARIAERFDTEATRIHAEAFPDAGGDIRRTARAALSANGPGGTSFLVVSDILGRALERHEDVSIDRVRFDRASGQFAFSIRSASDADIAAFRETLTSLGARSEETGGYRRSGAYWVGDMTVALS